MAQGRSLYREILKNFIDSIKPRNFQYKLIGKDYLGTEYYESPQSPQKKRTSRWFAPKKTGNFEQDIPPEWESWLRHKRKDPPTEEEIQLNLAKMRQTLENARRLEKPKTVSVDEVKIFEKPAFPTYEEFDFEPGSKKNQKV